ncbi:MAG: hypothetical protein ACR2HR_14685 [Euzebya sp.]
MRAALCVLVLLLTVALAGPVAAADPNPQVTDIAGDANAINGQGLVTGVGQATPADYAPADLRSVRYETMFEAVPVGGDGIDYRVTGLRAHIVTSAPAVSDGPTLIYRLNVDNFAEGKSVSTVAAEVRTLLVAVTAPAIDVTDAGTTFKIGSDMPKDVLCTVDCP